MPFRAQAMIQQHEDPEEDGIGGSEPNFTEMSSQTRNAQGVNIFETRSRRVTE